MTDDTARLGAAKYVVLTTHKKDGTAKPTAVWVAQDGARLVVWTVSDSWKVKRIRNNPEVLVQESDMRGRITGPPPVPGHAVVLDGDASRRVGQVIAKKYGVLGWLTTKISRLRRGADGTLGLAITLDT